MKHYTLLILLLIPLWLSSITLPECLEQGDSHFTVNANTEIYNELNFKSDQAIKSRWYPQFNISGNYNDQSESTEIDLGELPFAVDFPRQETNSYSLSLEMQQVLYDGGNISRQRKLSDLQYQSRIQESEAEKLQRHLLITSLYYQIMLSQSLQQILNLHKDNLAAELRKVSAEIEAGVLDSNNSLLIQEQLWKLAEEITGVNYRLREYLSKLNRLTELSLDENCQFENYQAELFFPDEIIRPELQNLNILTQMELTQSRIAGSGLLPRLAFNASYSWGNPGYDIFSDKAHTYYRAGINLSWQLWDWRVHHREQAIHWKQAQALQNSQTDKKEMIELTVLEKENEINKLIENLKIQTERRDLLQQIVENYQQKLEAGMISAEDYLQQSNKLREIELEQSATELQVSFQKVMQLFIMGGEL